MRRRDFNRSMVAALFSGSASSFFPMDAFAAHHAQSDAQADICFFSKPFQKLSYLDLGKLASDIGIRQLEFPLRQKGHLEPKDAVKKLPHVMNALSKSGVTVPLIASSFNDVNDPYIKDTLKACRDHGIKYYRLKYLRYDKSPMEAQYKKLNEQMKRLAELNAAVGIVGVYQNHAGKMVGAKVKDLPMILKGVSPEHLGVAFDIRHAVVEVKDEWQAHYEMIKPHLRYQYVKDCVVVDGKKPMNCPLGQGAVPKAFFDLLKTEKYSGPYSLHVEYHKVDGKAIDVKGAFKKDFKTLSGWIYP